MRSIRFMLFFGVLLTLSSSVNAQQTGLEGKFSGLMFGDYYAVLSNHVPTFKNQNGFWFRRIYFTYDKPLSPAFTTRFRLEVNSAGDFGVTSVRMTPFVKDAYLKWTRTRHNIIFGLSPSPIFEISDRIWGFRSIEKSLGDLQRLAGSREFGIAFQGALDPGKKLIYHLMVGNGADSGSETDQEKKVSLSLAAVPTAGFTVEGYVDWEKRPGKKDRYTVQGLLGYERPKFRGAALFGRQTRKSGTAVAAANIPYTSLFFSAKLASQVWGLARFDRMFKPNPDGDKIPYIPFDKTAKSSLLIFGFDLLPVKDVHLMPNIVAVLYDGSVGPKPKNDLIARLTAYYTF